MIEVTIDGDRAVFNVEGLDKLWSFRSRLDIPLAHITGIEAGGEQVGRWWHGFKLIGTDLPGLFAAGTFYYHGEMVFWDVSDLSHTVVVSLEHERYKKLIIEVADVEATIEMWRRGFSPARAELRWLVWIAVLFSSARTTRRSARRSSSKRTATSSACCRA